MLHDGHTHAAYHTLTKQKRTRSTDPLSCLLPITLSSKQAASARLAVVESQNRIGRLSQTASPNHEAARRRAASAAGRRGVCTAAPASPIISSTATTRACIDEVGPSSYSCCVPVAVFDPTLRIAFHSHVLHTHIRAHHTHTAGAAPRAATTRVVVVAAAAWWTSSLGCSSVRVRTTDLIESDQRPRGGALLADTQPHLKMCVQARRRPGRWGSIASASRRRPRCTLRSPTSSRTPCLVCLCCACVWLGGGSAACLMNPKKVWVYDSYVRIQATTRTLPRCAAYWRRRASKRSPWSSHTTRVRAMSMCERHGLG